MSVLHDRMPVILPIEAWATWLSPTANATQCSALLKPLENGLLTKTCVSNKVNRPFPDIAECLQPVDPPEPLTKKPLSS
jgi:putative SOS response-associated peptidase YedK